ncbi:reactive mitochondrial oxygen species modulator 1-domain-containing protein [Choanephora cucurbitarum]|nr:reactive mitochondrial oxygen species modulator 1-domain-containing protein [Choanephora cucurbitarum]
MEPSAFEKMKMGAAMGGTVGLCIGFVFGTVSLLRYGPGNKSAVSLLSQYMVGSAASFGFFMSIGSVVRSESRLPFAMSDAKRPILVKPRDNQQKFI